MSDSGLTARLSITENHLNWQDARLFTRYQGIRLGKTGTAKVHIYELIGEHGIVRWQWYHKRMRWSKTLLNLDRHL